MEARKDTDVNIKVNQRGLVLVSSPRRAEGAPGIEPAATGARNLERARGSAAGLSHPGAVSTGWAHFGLGARGTAREIHRPQLGKAERSDPGWDRFGWGWESPQAGSGAEHMGLDAGWLHGGGNSAGEEGECSTPGPGGMEEGWGISELVQRKRASHRGKCWGSYKLVCLDGKEPCEGFCMKTCKCLNTDYLCGVQLHTHPCIPQVSLCRDAELDTAFLHSSMAMKK